MPCIPAFCWRDLPCIRPEMGRFDALRVLRHRTWRSLLPNAEETEPRSNRDLVCGEQKFEHKSRRNNNATHHNANNLPISSRLLYKDRRPGPKPTFHWDGDGHWHI